MKAGRAVGGLALLCVAAMVTMAAGEERTIGDGGGSSLARMATSAPDPAAERPPGGHPGGGARPSQPGDRADRKSSPFVANLDGQAPSKPPCTDDEHAGGAWPSLNGDLRNTRSQPAESTIGVANASDLVAAWSFSGAEVGATGGMRSTPVVSGGCVFIGLGQGYLGDRGDVVALDADTGELVWHVQLEGSVLGLAVADGLVYATPSRGTRGEVALPVVTETYAPAGAYVVALDASTGKRRWTSDRLDDGNAANGTFINASPTVFRAGGRSMVFAPLSGGSGDGARVPMYFLDAHTGRTIAKSFSLTEAEYEKGFGGTGIWSTASFDEATGHLYAATADSEGRRLQHPYNNAILRIDADPRRKTFASVVDAYSGTTEHADLDAYIGSDKNPLCGAIADNTDLDSPTFFDTSAAPDCLEFDFDFGGSTNLHTNADGELIVTALQKSGVFHAVKAASMERDWSFYVGPGGPAMHGATAAVGANRLYVGATPNLVFGLDREAGSPDWVSATDLDLFAYQPLTLANGLLYAINDSGMLLGLDADTGVPVVRRPIAIDGGFPQCLGVGAGVAVARNTIFVPCDAGGPVDLAGLPSTPGGLVAYRLR